MHCPFCNAADSKVIDSRLAAEGCQIRRRRECINCGERFTTFESYEVVMQSLFALDHVAYVRFASVYQDFQDVEAFRRQIEQMQQR